MMQKGKGIYLYNVMFPLWFMIYFMVLSVDGFLLITLGNFVIDSVVLWLAMLIFKIAGKWLFYRKRIIKIFLFGLLSDILGTLPVIGFFLIMLFHLNQQPNKEELYKEHWINDAIFHWGFSLMAVVVAMLFLYFFNYRFTFKREEKPLRIKLALTIAIVTAPYTFLLDPWWVRALFYGY